MKFPLFTPTQKFLNWIQSHDSIQKLHKVIYSSWTFTDDNILQNPNQSFENRSGNKASYHWFLTYCLWKRFKTRVYLIELYRFVWKFPFIETQVVALKKNKDFTFSLINGSDIHIVKKISDITTLLKFPHIKSIYCVSTNQKVNL